MLQKNSMKNDKNGFSLIETLIAMGILAIITTFTMAVFIQQMNHGAQESNRRIAVDLMDDIVEKIYRIDINQLSDIINSGGFDEDYNPARKEYPNFSRRIIDLQQLPTTTLSYLIQIEIRWLYRDAESPPYTQWITKSQIGGN